MSECDHIHLNPDSPYYALSPWQREMGRRVARGERLRIAYGPNGVIAFWWEPHDTEGDA